VLLDKITMVLPFPESINRELDKNSPMSIGINKSRLVIGGSLYRDSLDTYYHGPPRTDGQFRQADISRRRRIIPTSDRADWTLRENQSAEEQNICRGERKSGCRCENLRRPAAK
jgi:hypothetical protein